MKILLFISSYYYNIPTSAYPKLNEIIKTETEYGGYCEGNVWEIAQFIVENIYPKIVVEKIDKNSCMEHEKECDYSIIIYDDYIE